MTHPSDYHTTPLGGLRIMVVDAGTEITDEATGCTETVTEGSAVTKGPVLWCTQKTYEALKAQVQ